MFMVVKCRPIDSATPSRLGWPGERGLIEVVQSRSEQTLQTYAMARIADLLKSGFQLTMAFSFRGLPQELLLAGHRQGEVEKGREGTEKR